MPCSCGSFTAQGETAHRACCYAAQACPSSMPSAFTPMLASQQATAFLAAAFHLCSALGCLDPQCALCQHNPNRRCSVNFDRKYLVGDMLKARCSASIRVELIDPATGMPPEEKIPDLMLQVWMQSSQNTQLLTGWNMHACLCQYQ